MGVRLAQSKPPGCSERYTHSESMMSFARGVGESRIRRAAGWTGLVLLGVLQFGHPAGAQGTSSAASARAAVEKALRGGRYDEVETLGKSSTDQAITVMRAQALIARGEYASAEQLLTPLATAGPNGDAALELGLLQMYVGRRSEARRTLQLLLMGDPREANGPRLRARRPGRARARTLRRRAIGSTAKRSPSPRTTPSSIPPGAICFSRSTIAPTPRSRIRPRSRPSPTTRPRSSGMARALADENPPAAMKFVRRALELNPSDVGAYLFLAELAIDEDKKTEAPRRDRQSAGDQSRTASKRMR